MRKLPVLSVIKTLLMENIFLNSCVGRLPMDKKKLLEQMNMNRDKIIAEMKKKALENPNMDMKLREAIKELK